MKKSKRIAIYQANLNVGGIQRSLVNLLNSGYLNSCQVDVFLFSKQVFYKLDALPNNIRLNFLTPFPFWMRIVPFNILKKSVKVSIDDNYDYVIDFDGYRQDCAIYATAHKNADKIMWIHNNIEEEYKYEWRYRILFFFFKGKYRYYNNFVAVSEGVVEPFRRKTKLFDKRITVIPNIVDAASVINESKDQCELKVDERYYNIICVGRLCIQKGYDLLLKDFRDAFFTNELLRLYIVGSGPDEKKLKKMVKKLAIDEVVTFIPSMKNPFSLEKQMDAYCMESRFEGQGIVFWEAKALGLQIIFPKRLEKYNNGLSGTNDIINQMIELKKNNKIPDYLIEYNDAIKNSLCMLFDSSK